MLDVTLGQAVSTVLLVAFLVWLVHRQWRTIQRLKDDARRHEHHVEAAALEARKDSNKRQRATVKGQITELLAPWSLTTVNSVSELSFLGNPIDFIGFKGLDSDDDVEIKLIEVKSGRSKLNKNQRRIRDAVEAKRIEWVEVRIQEIPVDERIVG
jgi:predicted Holliday junction resolvase-like endonuclease